MVAEKMTEREQFYYGKGYAQGKNDFAEEIKKGIYEIKDFMEEIMKSIYEIDDYVYDDYTSVYNTAINNVIDIIDKVASDSDGREEALKVWNERDNHGRE